MPDNYDAPATEDVEAVREWLSACSAASWDRYDIRGLKKAGERLYAALRAAHERARKAEEALEGPRAWYDAWCAGRVGMTRDEAIRLPEWDGMIDSLGYDADERRAARARESGGGA